MSRLAGCGDVEREIALAALAQTADEDRVYLVGLQDVLGFLDGRRQVHVKPVGVIRPGQLPESVEDQVGDIGEELIAGLGAEGVQHPVVGAGVDHVVLEDGAGVDDVAELRGALPVARDCVPAQVAHGFLDFTGTAQGVDLRRGQLVVAEGDAFLLRAVVGGDHSRVPSGRVQLIRCRPDLAGTDLAGGGIQAVGPEVALPLAFEGFVAGLIDAGARV